MQRVGELWFLNNPGMTADRLKYLNETSDLVILIESLLENSIGINIAVLLQCVNDPDISDKVIGIVKEAAKAKVEKLKLELEAA